MEFNDKFKQLVKLSYMKLNKEVKLKSGNMSNEYINLREALAYPEILQYVIEAMHDRWPYLFKSFNVDVLGGKAIGALPLLVAMSRHINKPYFYVRDKKKEHGLGLDRDGYDISGNKHKIYILEDVITTGSSVLEVIKDIQNRVEGKVQVFTVVQRDDHELIKGFGEDVIINHLWTLAEFRNVYQALNCEMHLAKLET